ncbi:MAG: HEAT repeat domain-containing protein, partial [Gemmatimonadetes bacterium]|nr:HEAT repeat domain-containing protein [Gemmatimonadota bacterium]
GDTLVAHLRDPDENVRMVVGNALAAHPAAAGRGMGQLIAAAQAPGEHRHVLRSVAVALGSIGPDARDALPVLRELEKMPLVRWQAQWAIRQILAQGR